MILVLSGTEEGKEIVRRLHEEGSNLLTTVATEYGKKMFEQMGLEAVCLQGRLDSNGFCKLIKEKGIDTVVDATHPYAVEVSQNAMDACEKANVRYLRFEREGTGISSVARFIVLKGEKELYVRILPVPEHIALCLDVGIPPTNIIAMHGPFSEDLNRAMFRQYRINTMVTKESGEAGGVLEKIHAARNEGIDTVVIERPRIEFPQKYSSIDEVVRLVKTL